MLTPEQRRIFSDLEKILRGQTGRRLDIGIITAENEMGKRLPDSENNKRNDMLYRKLRAIPNVRIYPIQGNFEGVDENSYIVTGVNLDGLKELAKEFGQLAFIYGTGVDDNVMFYYFENQDGEYDSVQVRRTFVYKSDADSNYSSYKGVKFVVPFFDDEYVNKRWTDLSKEDQGGSTEEEGEEEEPKMKESHFSRISKLIDALNLDEEDKVKIKVKHSDLLEIPEDKKFWEVPFKHYTDLVDKKGYAKVIRALTNLKVWNRKDDPSIVTHADKIMDKLKTKFKSENKSEGQGDFGGFGGTQPFDFDKMPTLNRIRHDIDNGRFDGMTNDEVIKKASKYMFKTQDDKNQTMRYLIKNIEKFRNKSEAKIDYSKNKKDGRNTPIWKCKDCGHVNKDQKLRHCEKCQGSLTNSNKYTFPERYEQHDRIMSIEDRLKKLNPKSPEYKKLEKELDSILDDINKEQEEKEYKSWRDNQPI